MERRRWFQIGGTIVANPWLPYLWTRNIYQGAAKGFCFPGFNCYACPLALFACPIGSLQHSFALLSPRRAPGTGLDFAALLYVIGFLGIIGAATGRMVCGWICPFGFLQDLLYKIPSPKWRLPRWVRFGKYGFLVFVAMLIPYLTGVAWYSRLCPAGALEGGIPLTLLRPSAGLPPVGWFFWLKIGILAGFLIWMVVSKRPFCRVACPLGAIYALFQPISLYRMSVDQLTCNKCKQCRDVCPVDIFIFEEPNSPECVRCLACKKACPRKAVTSGFRFSLHGKAGLSAVEQHAE